MDVKVSKNKVSNKKGRIWVALTAIFLIVCAWLYVQPSAMSKVNSEQLWFGQVKQGTLPLEVTGFGVLESKVQRFLTASFSAVVEEVLLKPGAIVTPESIILRMSNPDIGQAVVQAELALNAQKGKLKQLVLTQEREMLEANNEQAELMLDLKVVEARVVAETKLAKQGIVTQLTLLETQAKVNKLSGRLENNKKRLEKSLETIGFQKTKANIYAPASGEITRTMVKAGDVISPGMPMIEILNLSRVQVQAEVPETYLNSVKKGQTVTIKFPALDKETKARISLIGQQVNPANRTFKVEIDIPNSGNLKPNLLATVMIKDFEKKNAVVLPSNLIQQEVSGKSYVFIKNEGEKGAIATKIYVTISETYEGETYVSEGLKGNETFIIKGSRDLKDGELIEIK